MREHVIEMYCARARHDDITGNLSYLLGFPVGTYRRQATQAFWLRPGDTVVDVGCGTGLNFLHLEHVIGPTGRIIGVDLTDAMLAQAKLRVEKHGWNNVRLVQADALS
jgi:demethylmenaquinone methyltransferase/2-methoxy-6-polyprenyl-1,4-benzoquinol methylase